MTMRVIALMAFVLLAGAATAAAQTPATTKPAPRRATELHLGGVLAGPSSLGSVDAELLGGSGTPSVTLFRVENRLATGFGVEAGIGFEIRRGFWAEVGGGWTRVDLTSRITDDFEGAQSETITSPLSRFTLGGAAVWYLRERGATAWFVRANGGWMRETAGGNTLTGDGFIGGGGLGVRHWWRTAGKGTVKRIGFRAEARAVVRSGGITIGEKSLRFGPAGAAHIVFGF